MLWGFLLLFIGCQGGYFFVDDLLMPWVTRQQEIVEIPEVRGLQEEEARDHLAQQGINLKESPPRFDAEQTPGSILEQSPLPNTQVKPGHTVYVVLNNGEVPQVAVPHVKGFSRREARLQLQNAGLQVEDELRDPVPSPYIDTITDQQPSPGEIVSKGDSVLLWYGTGLGTRTVIVPNVTNMRASEASRLLKSRGLRSVVLNRGTALDDLLLDDPLVLRQSREPGTRVNEGFEIRLFIKEEGGAPDVD